MGPLTIYTALTLAAPFTGLFLFAGSGDNLAAYCQLTTAHAVVTGDCYSASVDVHQSGGVRRSHFVVAGDVESGRVLLRIAGLFGSKATWGTASADGTGFTLDAPSEEGVHTIRFRRASAADANRAMALVTARGNSVASAAQATATLLATERDYSDVAARYPTVVEDIARARRDSSDEAAKVALEVATMQALRDSIEHERVDWKRGSLQGHLGAAQGNLNAAETGVSWATSRIRESMRIASELRDRMARDSAYVAAERRP